MSFYSPGLFCVEHLAPVRLQRSVPAWQDDGAELRGDHNTEKKCCAEKMRLHGKIKYFTQAGMVGGSRDPGVSSARFYKKK